MYKNVLKSVSYISMGIDSLNDVVYKNDETYLIS